MKKTLLTWIITILTLIVSGQNITYNIFSTTTMNIDTGEPSSEIIQNYMKIYKEGTTLYVDEKYQYELYNSVIKRNGLYSSERFDAIDNYQQRCVILFATDDSADWSSRYIIVISYENNESAAMVYFSSKPIFNN